MGVASRRVALLISLAPAVAACGHGKDALPDTPGAMLGPHTHVVPREMLDKVMVQPDQLVFAQGDVVAQGWQPGDILAGDFVPDSANNPLGFLRRVVSIEGAGDQAILHTEQAGLAEAIASGDVEETFVFEPAVAGAAQARAPFANDVTLAIGPLGSHSVKIEGEKDGDPDIEASGTFGIEDLSASLGLKLDFGLKIEGFSVTSAHAIVSGDAEADLVPFSEFELELIRKTDIRSRLDFRNWFSDPRLSTTPLEIAFPDVKTKPHTVMISGLPVVVTGIMKSKVSCTVGLSARLEAKADIHLHGSVRAGFSYEGGAGMEILDGSATADVTPTYQRSIGGDVDCEAHIQLGVELDDAVDLLIGIKPYAKLEATGQPQCLGTNFVPQPLGTVDLTYGTSLTFDVELSDLLKFFGFSITISAPEFPLGQEGKISLGELGAPTTGEHCACGGANEPCCDTMVVNGDPCDPGLTCSTVSQNISLCTPGDSGEHACDTVNAHIFTSDDVAAIMDCTTLSSLNVEKAATVTSIDLPHLMTIGSIYLDGNALTQFRAPALEHASGVASFYAGGLTTIDLPNLRTVSGDFQFGNVNSLAALDVGTLTSVGGFFYAADAPLLQTVNAPALATVGGYVYLNNNPILQTVNMSALVTVGGYVYLGGNSRLQTINASAITAVGGGFFVINNPSLRVDLPNLRTVSGDFQFANANSLDIGALSSVGGFFYVADSPSLQMVNASALANVGGYFYINNNLSLRVLAIVALMSIGDYVYIALNPLLCVAPASTFALIARGSVYVENNGSCH